MKPNKTNKRKHKLGTSQQRAKTGKKLQHPLTRSKKRAGPRTHEDYASKSTRFQNIWDRVVGVITKMRAEKTSLQSASREIGVSPKAVKRWAGSAIQKSAGGKWAAKKSDYLLRVLVIPSPDGQREIAVRGSRKATAIGKLWNAIHRYLDTGDHTELDKFRGKFVTDANGVRFPLLTDRAVLNRLGAAGTLSFESIYGRGL